MECPYKTGIVQCRNIKYQYNEEQSVVDYKDYFMEEIKFRECAKENCASWSKFRKRCIRR